MIFLCSQLFSFQKMREVCIEWSNILLIYSSIGDIAGKSLLTPNTSRHPFRSLNFSTWNLLAVHFYACLLNLFTSLSCGFLHCSRLYHSNVNRRIKCNSSTKKYCQRRTRRSSSFAISLTLLDRQNPRTKMSLDKYLRASLCYEIPSFHQLYRKSISKILQQKTPSGQ